MKNKFLSKFIIKNNVVNISYFDKLDFKTLNFYQNGYTFQNGEVDTEEFMRAINITCVGKSFSELPNSFKGFVDSVFKTIDIDGTSCKSSPVTRSNAYFKK